MKTMKSCGQMKETNAVDSSQLPEAILPTLEEKGIPSSPRFVVRLKTLSLSLNPAGIVRDRAFGQYGTYTRSPEEVAELARALLKILEQDIEHGILFLLNARNRVIGIKYWSGSIDQTTIHPREICKVALLQGATSCVFVHNHPSGQPSPSTEDRALTATLKRALSAIEVQLVDSIVLGESSIFSFRDHGIMP